jgi:serine/threonine protein kinase
VLGNGNFSQVRLATNWRTGVAVAVKIMDKEKIDRLQMDEHIKHEIALMATIRHPNIVNMIEVMESPTKIFLVLELVTSGELFEYIATSGRLSEEEARKHFQQLISGVAYCHAAGICHRDLKVSVSIHIFIQYFSLLISRILCSPRTCCWMRKVV